VLVADAERRIVTLRLLMRPYPIDNDCEAIVVELVSCNSDGDGEGKGEDSPGWVRLWSSLIDVQNEVICTQ
jgi:hypothetical protein